MRERLVEESAVSSRAPIAAEIVDAAIDWMVLLRSGEMTLAQREQLERWIAISPQHHAVWQQVVGELERVVTPLRSSARVSLAERVLLKPRISRRRLLTNTLVVAGVACSAGVIANRYTPLADLTADMRTGTGERRSLALPDSSTLTLNARSAIDIDFSATQRRIHLHSGELLADGPVNLIRPLSITTACGAIESAGGQLLVRSTSTHDIATALSRTVTVRLDRG